MASFATDGRRRRRRRGRHELGELSWDFQRSEMHDEPGDDDEWDESSEDDWEEWENRDDWESPLNSWEEDDLD